MNNHVYADLLLKSITDNRGPRPACISSAKRVPDVDLCRFPQGHQPPRFRAQKARLCRWRHDCGDRATTRPEWVFAWHCGFLAAARTVPIDPTSPRPNPGNRVPDKTEIRVLFPKLCKAV